MELNTIYKLEIRTEEIEEGDNIKVNLKNGEVFIGEYVDSDKTSLNIQRSNFDDINIEFEEVEDLEII